MTELPEILRYTAFSADPEGGNPAGVVLDASGLDEAAMLAVAADLGYSETAFLTGRTEASEPGARGYAVRYFSPGPVWSSPSSARSAGATAVGACDRRAGS